MNKLRQFDVVYQTGPIRLTLHAIQHIGGCYVWRLDDSQDSEDVQVGDVLTCINKNAVSRMPLPDICKIIRETPLPLTITFQRAGYSFEDLISDPRLTPFYLEFLSLSQAQTGTDQPLPDMHHSMAETQVC